MGTLANGIKGIFGSGNAKMPKASKINESAFTQQLAGAGSQEALRKQQLAQSSRLAAQATGASPSIAEAQMRQSSNRSLAQQLGAAQAQRGGNAASRERMLAKSQSQAGRSLAEQSGIARLKEQQMAEQSLAGQLQNQRSQDIGLGQSDRTSAQGLEQLKMKQSLGLANIRQQAQQSADKAGSDMMGNVAKVGMMAFSDKNCKKNIKAEGFKISDKSQDLVKKLMADNKDAESKESKKLKSGNIVKASDKNCKKNISNANESDLSPKSFLDKLQAYSYDYKEPNKPGRGKGKHLSVMTQDLEKAGPVGRSMVEETEDGTKAVNYGTGFGAILAAQADLNQRLSEVEKKKKK